MERSLADEDQYLQYQEFDRVTNLRRRPRGSTTFKPNLQAPRLTQPLLPLATATPTPPELPTPTAPVTVAPVAVAPVAVAPVAVAPAAASQRGTGRGRAAGGRAGTRARGTRQQTGLAPSIRRNHSQWEGVTLDGVEPVDGGQPGARRTINGLSTGGYTAVEPRGARGREGTIASTSGRVTKPVAAVATRQSTRTRVATRRAAEAAAADAAQRGNAGP